jgi:hypothetical protein
MMNEEIMELLNGADLRVKVREEILKAMKYLSEKEALKLAKIWADPDNYDNLKIGKKVAVLMERAPNCTMEELMEVINSKWGEIREKFNEETEQIGQFAKIRRDYLYYYDEEHFWKMMENPEEFKSYLTKIEESSWNRKELLTEQLAKAEGVTEELKRENQMRWVGMMNNIDSRAKEIIIAELSQ